MGTGYTRQSSADIVDGLPITSSPLNNEFNAIKNAFDATTGHSHDGTVGEGPKITLTSGAGVSGILPISNGGTGASDAATARTNLGVALGTNVQPYDAGLTSIAGLTTTADQILYTTTLDTYATTALTSFWRTVLDDTTAAASRTTLDVPSLTLSNTWGASSTNTFPGNVISTGVSASAGYFFSRTGGGAAGGFVGAGNGGITLTSDTTAPITFYLNSVEVGRFNSSGYLGQAVVTGGSVTGITDIAILDGGTGASTASAARTNLAVPGLTTNNVLTANNEFQGNISSTAVNSPAVYSFSRTGTGATSGLVGAAFGGTALVSDDTNPVLIYTNGVERGRFNASGFVGNAAISGGSITGITDLAVADGGTGASSASVARDNLGVTSLLAGKIDSSSAGTTGLALLASNTADAAQSALNIRGPTASLADDTSQAYSPSTFSGTSTGGLLFVIGSTQSAGYGMAYIRTSPGSASIVAIPGASASVFEVVVGAPTAGTATDGSFTVGVNPSDGIVRFVNRRGSTFGYASFYLPFGN